MLNLEKLKVALDKEGFLFEQRVATILEKRKWMVTPNYHVEDLESGKSRELDIYGRFSVKQFATKPHDLAIAAIALISCKNNSLPFLFFTRDKNKLDFANGANVVLTGTRDLLHFEDGSRTFVSHYLQPQSWHHYFTHGEKATWFCQVTQSLDNPSINPSPFGSIIFPLIKATEMIRSTYRDKFFREDNVLSPSPLVFYTILPILVLKQGLYRAYYENDELKIKESNYIGLMGNYHSKEVFVQFHVDVMTEQYLPNYIDVLENTTFKNLQAGLADKSAELRKAPIPGSSDRLYSFN